MKNFETKTYDNLPVTVIIYESVSDEKGNFSDYRIVYGNRHFGEDYRQIYGKEDFEGALAIEDHLVDEYTLQMMDQFRKGCPQAFSTYIPHADLHVHMEPITALPEGYIGFIITNIEDFDEQESRVHFLQAVAQMNNIACLLRQNSDGSLSTEYVTPSFCELMECDSSEEAMNLMDGFGFYNSTHEEDRPKVMEMLKNRIASDGSQDLTIRKVTNKGMVIWCSVHYAFIDDYSEHYVYCTYADITVLKGYEDQLQSIYNSLGSSFYKTDNNALVRLRANLTANMIEEVSGTALFDPYGPEIPYTDALQRRIEYFPIAEEREEFLDTFGIPSLIRNYLDGHITVNRVLYSRLPDDTVSYVKITVNVTRHPFSGDLVAFITEESNNPEKLAATINGKILAKQFDLVAYIARDIYDVAIGDAALIKHGNIFPKEKHGSYVKYLETQIIPALKKDEEYRQNIRKAMDLKTVFEMFEVEEPYSVDIEVDMEDGQFFKRFDFYSVDPESEYCIVLKTDTTEAVRAERAQRDALADALVAAEHANRAKTTFLNNMSHDIRTPMNAIVGFTALAASHIDNKEQVQGYLSKISVSSQHLLSLINDVLDMSRIESGKMTLDEAEVHLPDMIHDLRTIIHANVASKQLELFVDTQDVVNEDIITDKLRLNQVFLNILSNAIKFTPNGGMISFRVIERPSQAAGRTEFEFHIKDTGIGMSKEFQKTIFEAFTREKTSTVSGIQGTGLGMAITKSIVDMMGGRIAVFSEEGKGTEFVVNIPCRLSSHPTKFEPIPELQGLRTLVADDDTDTCLSVCAMLRKIGMRPDWTSSGREAVIRTKEAMDQADAFSTYIIDWQMPDMNGIETVRRIRKVIGDAAPIIILTAYDWADIEQEALDAGVTAFCSKPLFMSELRNVLSAPFKAAEKKDEAPDEAMDFSGRHLLLAEDNEMNQMIAEAILTEAGFTLDIAGDGTEAVKMIEESPAGTYDVILMDIQMPLMDGYEAARLVRAMGDPVKAQIPIIAVTANAFEEDRKLALEAGMNGHLAKPYDIPKMMQTLGEILK